MTVASRLAPFAVTLLSTVLAAQQAAPAADKPELHPDVAALLDAKQRDAAFQRILARGEHRGPGSYKQTEVDLRVDHVMVCPQKNGLPIYAVFPVEDDAVEENLEKPKGPTGHIITVTGDGAILRVWKGNNWVEGQMGDANGDGIVERIETMHHGVGLHAETTVRVLFILPITEEVMPSLRVAFEVGQQPDICPEDMCWRVVPKTAKDPARVQIGTKDLDTGEFGEVTAQWRWLDKQAAWVGPGGGPNRDFLVLPPRGWDGIREFAREQLRKRQDG